MADSCSSSPHPPPLLPHHLRQRPLYRMFPELHLLSWLRYPLARDGGTPPPLFPIFLPLRRQPFLLMRLPAHSRRLYPLFLGLLQLPRPRLRLLLLPAC